METRSRESSRDDLLRRRETKFHVFNINYLRTRYFVSASEDFVTIKIHSIAFFLRNVYMHTFHVNINGSSNRDYVKVQPNILQYFA